MATAWEVSPGPELLGVTLPPSLYSPPRVFPFSGLFVLAGATLRLPIQQSGCSCSPALPHLCPREFQS